jgi:hypothetical protein
MTDTRITYDNAPSPSGNRLPMAMRGSNVGQAYTMDWVTELVEEGRVFTAHIGSLVAGADIGLITGGGAGTTIDSDQPEAIVGVAAGSTLIPIEVALNIHSDQDADADHAAVLLFADLTQAPPASATATAPTVTNLNVASGVSSVATIHTAVTVDITDTVMTQLIDYQRVQVVDNGTAASAHLNGVHYNFLAKYPFRMKGPCSLVLCYGGTVAVSGMGRVTWAEVPTGRFDVF